MEQPHDLPELARRYAAGELSWPEIRDGHDAHFGELLLELARQGLPLPLTTDPARVERVARLLRRPR